MRLVPIFANLSVNFHYYYPTDFSTEAAIVGSLLAQKNSAKFFSFLAYQPRYTEKAKKCNWTDESLYSKSHLSNTRSLDFRQDLHAQRFTNEIQLVFRKHPFCSLCLKPNVAKQLKIARVKSFTVLGH